MLIQTVCVVDVVAEVSDVGVFGERDSLGLPVCCVHCQERWVFFGETTCAYDFELGYIDLEAESEGEGADDLYLPLKGDVRW